MAAGIKTGGRVKGTPNKATAEIKSLAQSYTGEAMEALAKIMRESDSDAAKVAAIKEILDRGHGKPAQAVKVGGDDESPLEMVMRWALKPSEATHDPSKS